MTLDLPDAPELPDLPAFDKHAMRRAVRRGVIRTAFVGALWLLLASFVLSIGGKVALSGLGREDHLQHVVVVGWQVAHPEFFLRGSGQGSGIVHTTASYDATPLVVQPAAAAAKLSFRESLFGGVSRSYPDPTTAASQILQTVGNELYADVKWKTAERKMLEQLPKPVRVAAIVEFAQPLSYADYKAFVDRTGATTDIGSAPLLLGTTGDFAQEFGGPNTFTGVCAWAPFYGVQLNHGLRYHDDPIGGFRAWVASLHDSDSGALAKVGVKLSLLRDSARAGVVHGVIVQGTSAAVLLKLLNDPAVRAVHPYDVAFAVEGSR